MMRLYSILLVIAFGLTSYAHVPVHEDITIYARDGVECYDAQNICIAIGQAWAKKKDVTLYGDQLKLYFIMDKGRRSVKTIEATGHARLIHASGTLKGEYMRYDISSAQLYVEGPHISLTTENYCLTAHRSLTYSHKTFLAKSVGKTSIQQKDQGICAEIITAQFIPISSSSSHLSPLNQQSSFQIKWVRAKGQVKVWKEHQKGYADKGFYEASTQKAHLQGHVYVCQEQDFAKGDHAILDLKNKTSALKGAPARLLIIPKTLTSRKKKSS